MKKTIITVTGRDTVGIIARVCTYLAEQKVNIEDISQTIIQGFFHMMMIADTSGSPKGVGELAEDRPCRLRIKEEIPVFLCLSEIRYQIQHYVVEHQRDECLVGVELNFEEGNRKAQKSAREHRGDAHQKDRQRSGKPCNIECHDSGADGAYKELAFVSDVPEPHLE